MRKALFHDAAGNQTGKARICGLVYHPLIDNQAGKLIHIWGNNIIAISIFITCVPPGVGVKLELFRASDQLAVDCYDDPKDANYHAPKIVICHASLHVPTGSLGDKILNLDIILVM